MEQYPLLTPVMGEPERTNSEKELEAAFKDEGYGLLDVYVNDVSPKPVDHDNDSVDHDNDSVKD